MEQYGAHQVATVRRTELAAEAAMSRLAAAARKHPAEASPALVAGHPHRTRPATA